MRGGGSGTSATFATPDIIDHASFETFPFTPVNNSTGAAGGFGNWGGPPLGDQYGTLSSSTDTASHGTHSAKVTFTASALEQVVVQWYAHFGSTIGALDEFYGAVDLNMTAVPSTPFKFMRCGDTTNWCGGVFTNGSAGICWLWDIEDSANNTSFGVTNGMLINNGWNNLEYHYMRNSGSSPTDNPNNWPAAEFWWNGVKTYLPDGPNPAGGSVAYWLNGVYYAGARARSAPINKLEICNTMNANNLNVGTIYIDNFSLSTQRIGPN